jgi:hypothetical protein
MAANLNLRQVSDYSIILRNAITLILEYFPQKGSPAKLPKLLQQECRKRSVYLFSRADSNWKFPVVVISFVGESIGRCRY